MYSVHIVCLVYIVLHKKFYIGWYMGSSESSKAI